MAALAGSRAAWRGALGRGRTSSPALGRPAGGPSGAACRFKQNDAADSAAARNTFPFSRHGAEPPAEYAEMRKRCPVMQGKIFDGTPIWMISTLKELKAALTDSRLSKVRTHPGFPELREGAKAAVEGREPTFVDMDPPQHTKFRSMFEQGFSEERVEQQLRPFISQKAKELIDAMKLGSWKGGGGEAVDLAESFSLPLAFSTIYTLLGIPPEDHDRLSANVAVRASGSSTARDAAAAQAELASYMQRLVDAKASGGAGPRGLLDEVVEQRLRGGEISREQLAAHAFLLLVAGNATVATMLNVGVVTLLQHPDQLELLRSEPGRWRAAAAELCRLHTASALALRRVALEDVEVGDQVVGAGQGVIALNESANRDEQVFTNPDAFDVLRDPEELKASVAFGFGPHVCPGEYLSLVEMEVGLRELFERLPRLRLAAESPEKLPWGDPAGDIALRALPVTWG